MNVYLCRHGETELNRKMRLQGQIDTQLDATGIEEAKEAGAFAREHGLFFDRVYSSSLARALDTAVLVSGKDRKDIRIDDRVIEMDYGPYDGQKFTQLDRKAGAFLMDPVHAPLPEGFEAPSHVEWRTADFLKSLAESEVPGREENVLVVTHGVAIRAMLRTLDHLDPAGVWKVRIDNCDLLYTECRNGVYEKTRLFYRRSGI